jgi:hypothetical protein
VHLQAAKVLEGLQVQRRAQDTRQPLVKQVTVQAGSTLTLALDPVDGDLPIINAMQIEEVAEKGE